MTWGKTLLKAMKVLEKRNFKDSAVLSDALSYIHLKKILVKVIINRRSKSFFDQVINKLLNLSTEKRPFCQGEMVDNTEGIILKPYIKSSGFSSFSGSYKVQCNEHVWLGNLTWSCYGCET